MGDSRQPRSRVDLPHATPHAPVGWPAGLRPPGAGDWEADAAAFLFDRCPADFRRHRVLWNHPVVLAHVARRFVAAEVGAADAGIAEVRTHLAGLVSEATIQAGVEAWQTEAARLARARRAVGLIEGALRATRGLSR